MAEAAGHRPEVSGPPSAQPISRVWLHRAIAAYHCPFGAGPAQVPSPKSLLGSLSGESGPSARHGMSPKLDLLGTCSRKSSGSRDGWGAWRLAMGNGQLPFRQAELRHPPSSQTARCEGWQKKAYRGIGRFDGEHPIPFLAFLDPFNHHLTTWTLAERAVQSWLRLDGPSNGGQRALRLAPCQLDGVEWAMSVPTWESMSVPILGQVELGLSRDWQIALADRQI